MESDEGSSPRSSSDEDNQTGHTFSDFDYDEAEFDHNPFDDEDFSMLSSRTNTNSDSTEDEDILEENNNDPNNNLDDENNVDEVSVNVPSLPQPGCSKDLDSMGHTSGQLDDREIQSTAETIYNNISKLTLDSILSGLRKATNSGNTTVTLFDLLPEHDAAVKRTSAEDLNAVNSKKVKCSDTLPGPSGVVSVLSNPVMMSHNIKPILSSPVIRTAATGARKKDWSITDVKFNLPGAVGSTSDIKPVIKMMAASSSAPIQNKEATVTSNSLKAQQQQPYRRDYTPVIYPTVGQSMATSNKENTNETHKYRGAFPKQPLGIYPTAWRDPGAQAREIMPVPRPAPKHDTHTQASAYHYKVTLPKRDGSGLVPARGKVSTHESAPKHDAKVKYPHYPTNHPLPSTRVGEVRAPGIIPAKPVAPKLDAVHRHHTIKQQLPPTRDGGVRAPIIIPTQPVAPKRDATVQGPHHVIVQQQPPTRDGEARAPIIIATKPEAPKRDNEVCMEIYSKLRAMFPNLQKQYIMKFCPPDWHEGLSHDLQLASIVDRLLACEDSWVMEELPAPIPLNANAGNKPVANVDETFEYLVGIFPDADPHYLRKSAMGFKDENAIKAFVDENLQNAKYPTRDQYMAKLKITQEQERYTTNFVVSDFLKIFPEPFQYFEDPKRDCVFDAVGYEFLKAHFNRVRANTITHTYRQYQYNLSLTAKSLLTSKDFIQSKRPSREMPTEYIPLLQEMAFIRHQEEIKEHISSIAKKEALEFQALKACGGLLQCQCCYDAECMPTKVSTCDGGHIFCNSCIITGSDARLAEGDTHVPCFSDCGKEFSLSTLQNVLAPTKFSILLKKRQAAEVMAAGLEGLVACPFCHFASIPEENDKVFKCLNPECMKESCILCKEKNHVPLKCHEVEKTDKARKYIEEKMTQALARSCYKCKKSFFKEEGCNKITCPCGAIMCFICNSPIKDYSHFRGQGSNDSNKCPLWSDNTRLNAETVRRVAREARDQLLKEDPTLRINTERLEPALPPPTAGPHNDIAGADNLAIQLAARVMQGNK